MVNDETKSLLLADCENLRLSNSYSSLALGKNQKGFIMHFMLKYGISTDDMTTLLNAYTILLVSNPNRISLEQLNAQLNA